MKVELHIGTPSDSGHQINLAGVPRVGDVVGLDVKGVGVNVRVDQVVWVANPGGSKYDAVLLTTRIEEAEAERLYLHKLG